MDGLEVIANQHVKYDSYQVASNISHSPIFSKTLNQEKLLIYVIELIARLLLTIIDSIFHYLEESNIETDNNIKNKITDSEEHLFSMIKVMKANAKQ